MRRVTLRLCTLFEAPDLVKASLESFQLSKVPALLGLLCSLTLMMGCGRVADTDLVGYAYPSVVNAAALSYSDAAEGLSFNQLLHNRELVDHEGAGGIVSPNNDTLYSGLSLDLRQSPQIVTLPSVPEGTYQSMMITDLRAYNVAEIVNDRGGGRFMFAVLGYSGEVPADVQLIETESDILLGIVRTEVVDADDLSLVFELQDGIRIDPLLPVADNLTRSADLPSIDPDSLEMSVLNHWVALAQWAMRHSPALDASDLEYKTRIEQLTPGLLNKIVFAYGVYRLKRDGANMTSTRGLYGRRDQVTGSHWERGAITTFSHLALSPERALYPTLTVDSDGEELLGCRAYTATFKDVPVRAFWSLTVYETDSKQFVPNPQQLYRISNKTAVQAADGSVTIHLGGDPDADNYLPLPADCAAWYTMIRFYEPEQPLLDGSWPTPQIVLVD
ncbi:MAG: DUF1214 domain-containing protein [Pseudomonadota bacterium]